MEFFESALFTKLLPRYLSEDSYREFQLHLAENPEAGDPIPDTGGFRKIRWADSKRGKGKRGGLRIIYFVFLGDSSIWLMTLYGKDEMDDLSSEERKLLKEAIKKEKEARASRRRNVKRVRR